MIKGTYEKPTANIILNEKRLKTFPKDQEQDKNAHFRDFPGCPVVKNLPSNAGDVGSIPGRGTKIPHAAGQLSSHTTTTELLHLIERSLVPQTTEPTRFGTCAPQLEREKPACHNKEPACRN